MNGFKKSKKLTAKQLQERNDVLESENMMLKLDIRQRTADFMTQLQIFEGIMTSSLEQASTIGEARRWYAKWVADVNALPVDAPNQKELMENLMKEHGFEFEIKDHGREVDEYWSKK
jgi:hypothetical protein